LERSSSNKAKHRRQLEGCLDRGKKMEKKQTAAEIKAEEKAMVERIEQASLRLEAANRIAEDLVLRQEKDRDQNILGGQSEGGAHVEQTHEEKVKSGMIDYFKGTAIERMLQ